MVRRARWALISRRSLASSGEAWSSISPPGSTFVDLVDNRQQRRRDWFDDAPKLPVHVSFQAESTDAREQRLAANAGNLEQERWARAAFSILRIATASDGSAMPLNDQFICFSLRSDRLIDGRKGIVEFETAGDRTQARMREHP